MTRALATLMLAGLTEAEARVREIVREELAVASGRASQYSSHALPLDVKTKRAFAEACRRIPGAVREGKVWRVDREAWHRARARRHATAPIRLLAPANAAPSDEDLADHLLDRAGYRRAR